MNQKSYRHLHAIQSFFFRVATWFELMIACCVIAGIAVYLIHIPEYIILIKETGLIDYLKYLFDILIGIELLKVLCRKDLDSMVEVLLFAVTRYLIISHLSIFENLIGIIAIAVLFAIRKYLFISPIEKDAARKKSDYLERQE